MKLKRLTSYRDRKMARVVRDQQWAFAERVAREGTVWICPWDKHHRHGADGVYVFGLLGSNEFFQWLHSHRDWWQRGRWLEKRCARSIQLTELGRKALANREKYDMEDVAGGMVEPGWVARPAKPKHRKGA